MGNKIARYLAIGLALTLLGYSAYRSWHFVAGTLPDDKQVIAYFALAALDGGIIAWLLSYLYGAHGSSQRAIALLMVIVDFLGAVAMFTLDTLITTGERGLIGQMSPQAIQVAVLALSLIIAINIGATIAYHLTDPESLRRQAEEEARSEIEDQALALIRDNSRALASEIAPQIASNWKAATALEYSHRLKKPRETKQLPAQIDDEPEANPTKARRRT